jgi:hypothetical protein
MSTILELTAEIRDVDAAIKHHERALIDSPTPSVEASLRSLKKRLSRLETEFAAIAADTGVDVCRYRFFSDYVRATIRPVGNALVDFQSVFTLAYNAIATGKSTARITPDLEELTAFGFGYAYTGSLGIALTLSTSQLEMFESNMDVAMNAVFALASAKTQAELTKYGKQLGSPAIKAIHRWAATHAKYGLGADIAWVRGDLQKSRLVMESSTMANLVGVLQKTSHKETEILEVEGTFEGGEHAKTQSFHFVADDGTDYKGKYTDAISELNPVLLPKRYRAYIQKTTKVFYTAEEVDKPTYFLLRLESLS